MIETVIIPCDRGRNTVCVSSQVGCAMNCQFCYTGRYAFFPYCKNPCCAFLGPLYYLVSVSCLMFHLVVSDPFRRMGLTRHLTAAEIVEQAVFACRLFSDEVGPISNVVFMVGTL